MKSSNSMIEAISGQLLTDQLRDNPHMNLPITTDSSQKSSLIDTLSIEFDNYNIQHNNISHK